MTHRCRGLLSVWRVVAAAAGPDLIAGSIPAEVDRTRPPPSRTIARLRGHGAELLGEVAQYESGPAGIIVALAEQIG